MRQNAYQPVVAAGRSLRDALRDTADAIDNIPLPQESQGRYSLHALEEQQALLGVEARRMAKLADAILWASDEPQLLDDDPEHDSGHLVQWINIAEISFKSAKESRNLPGGPNRPRHPEPLERWHFSTRIDSSRLGNQLNLRTRSVRTAMPTARGRGGGFGFCVGLPVGSGFAVGHLASQPLLGSHFRDSDTGVGDDFSYPIGRLGLGDAETKLIPSPFTDLHERHLVLLTDYLPAPRGRSSTGSPSSKRLRYRACAPPAAAERWH